MSEGVRGRIDDLLRVVEGKVIGTLPPGFSLAGTTLSSSKQILIIPPTITAQEIKEYVGSRNIPPSLVDHLKTELYPDPVESGFRELALQRGIIKSEFGKDYSAYSVVLGNPVLEFRAVDVDISDDRFYAGLVEDEKTSRQWRKLSLEKPTSLDDSVERAVKIGLAVNSIDLSTDTIVHSKPGSVYLGFWVFPAIVSQMGSMLFDLGGESDLWRAGIDITSACTLVFDSFGSYHSSSVDILFYDEKNKISVAPNFEIKKV